MTLIALSRPSFRRLLKPDPACRQPGAESTFLKDLLDTGMHQYYADIISRTALGLIPYSRIRG